MTNLPSAFFKLVSLQFLSPFPPPKHRCSRAHSRFWFRQSRFGPKRDDGGSRRRGRTLQRWWRSSNRWHSGLWALGPKWVACRFCFLGGLCLWYNSTQASWLWWENRPLSDPPATPLTNSDSPSSPPQACHGGSLSPTIETTVTNWVLNFWIYFYFYYNFFWDNKNYFIIVNSSFILLLMLFDRMRILIN